MSDRFDILRDSEGPADAADTAHAALRAGLQDLPFADPGPRFDAAVLSALAPRPRKAPWWMPNLSGLRSASLAAASSLAVTLVLVNLETISQEPGTSSLANAGPPPILAAVEQVLDSANVTAATLIRLSAQRRVNEEEQPPAADGDRTSSLEPITPHTAKASVRRRSA